MDKLGEYHLRDSISPGRFPFKRVRAGRWREARRKKGFLTLHVGTCMTVKEHGVSPWLVFVLVFSFFIFNHLRRSSTDNR